MFHRFDRLPWNSGAVHRPKFLDLRYTEPNFTW